MVTKSFTISGGLVQTIGAALGTPGVRAKSLQLLPDSTNSGTCLIGGPNINPGSASPLVGSTGFPMPKGDLLYLPYASIWTDLYDFDNCYVFVETGDNLHILYEQG